MDNRTTVLIADNSEEFCSQLATMLQQSPGLQVVGMVNDGEQCLRAVLELKPDVLILEGIHCFHDPRLLELMYLKLYMNVDADICLLRRIERDITERGRSIDSISDQYRTTVRPMFEQYIRNYINLADVIVARGGKNARIVEILAGYVSDELHKRQQENA